MTMLRISVEGEVRATPGVGLPAAAGSGKWTAGPVTCTVDKRLVIGGKPVVKSATCTFIFAGVAKTGTPPPAVADSSTVTLSPKPSLLRTGADLMRASAKAQDSYGNTLTAVAAGPVDSG
ncbi:MAG: hypothetical protein H7317_06985 [Pseudorhodobacter sp.]|nr:hypothetical protein [Pseudorhodobacter sp.]